MVARLRSYVPRPYGTLKEAAASLIEAAGGFPRAAEIARVGQSTLHAYTDPARPDVHMPIDIALALEAATGSHAVTEFLAHSAGLLVLVLPPAKAESEFAIRLATLGQEAADVFGSGARALADGMLDAAEASTWLEQCDEMLAVGGQLRQAIAARIEAAPRRSRR